MRRLILLFLMYTQCLFSQKHQLFELVPSDHSNIEFDNQIIDTKDHSILKYSNYYGGAGVAIADLDNDGLQDIFFAGNLVDDKLYKNLGNLKFEDVSKKAGLIADGSWSTSVVIGDVNNDGFADIYVTCELYDNQPKLRTNKLYINKGNFQFEESAAKFHVDNSERTRGATFIDYDKDGYLDLFLLNQPPNPGNYSKFSGQALLRKEWSPRLYRNDGGRNFIDVSERSGIAIPSYPNGAVAADLNQDGWQDLYITNDYDAPDMVMINKQDGTFSNIADEALGHMSYYSMGVDIADINNDGLLDIMTLDMVAEDNYRQKANMGGMYPEAFWKLVNNGGHFQYMYNTLQLNYGSEHFGNIAQMAGVSNTDWSWSNIIADFDNDGWKDIYVTNGLLRDIRNSDIAKEFPKYVTELAEDYMAAHPNANNVPILEIMDLEKGLSMHPSVPLQNYSYKNNRDLTFKKSNSEWGLTNTSFSNGCAYSDLDNDGDLEIIVNNINEKAFLYKNNSTSNYIRIELEDDIDKFAIQGSKIEISANNAKQFSSITSSRGMYSYSEPVIHFGIGDASVVDTITITWPDGCKQSLTNIIANQKLHILKSSSKYYLGKSNRTTEYHVESGIKFGIDFEHHENVFDDYSRQILLPHKLSQLGPALAVADVNKDGLEDFYIGGASGQLGNLFIQNKDATFEKSTIEEQSENQFEDTDAIFFDYDNDGDVDLYVMSGGNEKASRHKNYLDRIYDNDGFGKFTRNDQSLPRILESGSCVKPFDFDNDGDLDLFLGGRHNPWDYPTPSISRILENRNGQFYDITKEKAPGFIFNGMVTDASWTDYNDDGLPDLIVVGEWMPITFYKNTSTGFTRDTDIEITKNNLKIKTNGWWNHIQSTDIDNDGDVDFILGNLGNNYKYKANQQEPFEVHYDDFDNNGKKDIVLSYYNFGDRFPLRGRSCSAQQVPIIKDQFPTYDLFASAELTDIYSEKALDQSLHLEAFMFEHIILYNNGENKFEVKSLPNELQVSSLTEMIKEEMIEEEMVEGEMVEENVRISKRFIVAGNMYQSEIETPRNDASVGAVVDITNDQLVVRKSSDTGIYLPYDIRKLSKLTIGGKASIIVASNNDIIRIIQKKS